MKININVNKAVKEVEINGGDTLYDVLRGLGFTSVRKSCGTSSCGVCTVLMDGSPVASCSYLAAKADGHSITTIEGAQEEAERIGAFMNQEGSVQCGYCTPGFILTVMAMKNELQNPDDESIKAYLVGNLCRCTGYEGQHRAIKKYLGVSE